MRFLSRRVQAQLLAWTALILVISVAVTNEVRTYIQLNILERNLRDRSETMAEGVDTALRIGLVEVPVAASAARLREYVDADPTLTRLDIVENREGTLYVAASSDPNAQLVIERVPEGMISEIRTLGDERVLSTVRPIEGTRYSIVAMSTLENIDRFQASNRTNDPIFGLALIIIVIALMNFMYQRTVSKRFNELLAGIRGAQEGDFAAIPVAREDEIGVIARTLNTLLIQVRSFNDELKREVTSATENLNKRNIELEGITKQMVAMQRQLLQAERLATVGQMAATFAHEIGSPMSSLSVHVQLLLEDPRLEDEQRETLTLIREQIQAMVQIVNDLLRSARRGPADFVPADVNEILQTVLKLVQPKLMSQKIAVTTDFKSLPKVRAYPLYLQEAFLNLINNSSDAMPGGGQLTLQTWYDPPTGRVHIRIADTGPGIESAIVEHIFDHFVTTKDMGDGTGLGLGIVKEIVNGHRGTVRIESEAGGGTAAYITLPSDTGVPARAERAAMVDR